MLKDKLNAKFIEVNNIPPSINLACKCNNITFQIFSPFDKKGIWFMCDNCRNMFQLKPLNKRKNNR